MANIIEASKCSSTEDVIREMEKEVRGDEWGKDKHSFEQHMLEEDRIRTEWKKGEFEKNETCWKCGDKNAGIKSTSVAKYSARNH